MKEKLKSVRKPETVDEYISMYPREVQKKLRDIRRTIRNAAPQAIEKIGYGMPAYIFKGMLVYFAGHAKHIGFYPGPSAIVAFKKQLADYANSKGTVQFPLDQELPLELIAQMVWFRVQENIDKAELKARKKSSRH